jgi:putative transcriptional regulator
VLHEGTANQSEAVPPYASSLKIKGGLEMTTSKDVLEALSSGTGPRKVLITLGYSGWGAGQLEDEMSRNNWINVNAAPEIIFDTPVEQRYGKALSLLGISAGMLSQQVGHA